MTNYIIKSITVVSGWAVEGDGIAEHVFNGHIDLDYAIKEAGRLGKVLVTPKKEGDAEPFVNVEHKVSMAGKKWSGNTSEKHWTK